MYSVCVGSSPACAGVHAAGRDISAVLILQALDDVALGYLTLCQAQTSLTGRHPRAHVGLPAVCGFVRGATDRQARLRPASAPAISVGPTEVTLGTPAASVGLRRRAR